MTRITQIKNLTPRPAIGGYIRIGRTVSGKGSRGTFTRPDKLDHFEVTTTNVIKEGEAENFEPDVKLMEDLLAAFEDKGELDKLALCGGCDRAKALGFEHGLPRRMPIVLADDDLSVTFPSAYRWYRGRTVFCEGDGEQAFRRTEEAGEKGVTSFSEATEWTGPCGDACPDLIAGRCKPNATLNLVAPFQQRVGTLYRFSTTSRNSFRSILGGLKWIGNMVGTISWLPLFLEMTERKVTTREGRTAKAWIVSLFFDGTPQQLLAAAGEEYLQIASGKNRVRQLLASIDEVEQTDEQLDVQLAEFAQDAEVVEVEVPTSEAALGDQNAKTKVSVQVDPMKDEKKPAKKKAPRKKKKAETVEDRAAKFEDPPHPAESKQEPAEVGFDVPADFQYDDIHAMLKQADHPVSMETIQTFDHNKCVSIYCWAHEQILLLDAIEAGVIYECRPFPRPSFIPEYGEHEEREKLGMVDGAEPKAAEPVAAPASNGGDYDAGQLEALAELGWDGEGDAPTVTPKQRAGVIEKLKLLELVEPAKCLDFISTALERPITTTGELSVDDVRVIYDAVDLVLKGGADGQQGLNY